MKVLFLDIDGVLNCDSTKEKINLFTGLDTRLLNKFLTWAKDKPDLAVVLSSTWRTKEDFWPYLRERGLSWIDITPDHSKHAIGEDRTRGAEVLSWLSKHPEVTHYALLDDSQDFHAQQLPYFVQTSPKHGLRDKNLTKLNKILGYEPP